MARRNLDLRAIFLYKFQDAISDFFSRVVRGEAYGLRIEATTPSVQRERTRGTHPYPSEDEFERYVSDNPRQVITEYRRLLNGYWFERVYNLIYGSQIALLEYLMGKGTEGEKYVNLIPFYDDFLRKSALKTTQFADYLGFLRDMQYIEIMGEDPDLTAKIIPFGIDFITYIKGQYDLVYKYKLFKIDVRIFWVCHLVCHFAGKWSHFRQLWHTWYTSASKNINNLGT